MSATETVHAPGCSPPWPGEGEGREGGKEHDDSKGGLRSDIQ